jgi:hypothetical protein
MWMDVLSKVGRRHMHGNNMLIMKTIKETDA